MGSKLGYDVAMKRLIWATVAGFALLAVPGLAAQIRGVPASVTSIGFGGHFNQPQGIPASVTSIGPLGLVPGNTLFPTTCCINPLFPVNANPHGTQHHHSHHRHNQLFGQGLAVYPLGYPVAYEVPVEEEAAVEQPEEYSGGPTIFDRRGPGAPSYGDRYREQREERIATPEPAPAVAAPETPVPDQPKTVLIFKDGHQSEVENYAVIGDTLFDLSEGRRHKIPLADLDLTATARENDDRGIDFTVPSKAN